MLKKLTGFFTGGAAKGVRDIASTFVVPKDTREMNQQEYKLAILDQFKAYTQAPKEGFFARFVGALNGLPRPALALGIIAMFAMAFINPQQFTASVGGLQLIPTEMWGMMGIVVSFYMGGRLQIKNLSAKERMARLDSLEKTSKVVMDMVERLDQKGVDNKTTVD